VAIAYSFLSIINLVLVWLGIKFSFNINSNYIRSQNLLDILWFLFNIGIFVSIFIKKIEKRALILPSFYILKSFILVLVSMTFGIFMSLIGVDPLSAINWSNLFGMFAPMLLEIIALIIVIRFLLRKSVANNLNAKKYLDGYFLFLSFYLSRFLSARAFFMCQRF